MSVKKVEQKTMENLLELEFKPALDYEKRLVTICSSMKFRYEIRQLRRILKEHKISFYYPQIILGQSKRGISPVIKKRLTMNFLHKIDNSDILYILNINDYIGNSVLLEIGYAFAKKKIIIAKEKVKDPDINAMVTYSLGFNNFVKFLKKKKIAL